MTPTAAIAGVVAVPDEGRGHVNEGQPLVYRHSPPSSGTHYAVALPGGIYRQEANPGYWVHSLEHGYVVALVKCASDCAAVFDRLQVLFTSRLPPSQFGTVKFIATPYSQPYTAGDAPLALVAWGQELLLQSIDEDAIVRFYGAFADKGPEAVP